VGTLAFEGEEHALKVARIYENRYPEGKGGNCYLALEIPPLGDAWVLTQAELIKAEDDTGRDLIPEKGAKQDQRRHVPSGGSKVTARIRLSQTNRAASRIRSLEGHLHLQKKAAGQEDTVTVKDFRATPGEFHESAELERAGIQIAYLDAQSLDEKGADLVLAAIMPRAVPRPIPADRRRVALTPMKAMVAQSNVVLLVVRDPSDKVLRIEAVNTKTGKTTTAMRSTKGLHVAMLQATELQEDEVRAAWRDLRIHLKNEKATKRALFRLANVPLP